MSLLKILAARQAGQAEARSLNVPCLERDPWLLRALTNHLGLPNGIPDAFGIPIGKASALLFVDDDQEGRPVAVVIPRL